MMAVQECIWLLHVLWDLGQDTDHMDGIYCDNQSAIRLAKILVIRATTNHIEDHHHYIREEVLSGEFELGLVTTKDQVFNIFTKALAVPKFMKFMFMLGVCIKELVMRGMFTTLKAIMKNIWRVWKRSTPP